MSNIEITKARKQDWPYIKEKLVKYALDKNDAQWHHFFVAKINNQVKGFGRIIDRGSYVEVASLGVDYYRRKQGIGKKLLEFLIQKSKKLYPDKKIYGVTHRPGFLMLFGFKEVKDAPAALEHKKKNECILEPAKIKIMMLGAR
jgi:N-acetylglutamate synthase-like GNAT family acetyltransferase